jgi:hypothetical protein
MRDVEENRRQMEDFLDFVSLLLLRNSKQCRVIADAVNPSFLQSSHENRNPLSGVVRLVSYFTPTKIYLRSVTILPSEGVH